MFGLFNRSKKEQKRDTLEQNRENGKRAENMYRTEAEINGVSYKRTGIGHDFEEERHDWNTGKTRKVKVEVKSNNASLSKLQKKTRKKNPKNYEVRRYDTSMFGLGGVIRESTKKQKRTSKKTNSGFNLDDVFGSGNGGGWF